MALPVPISPVIENLIPYLFVYILIDSASPKNSLQILPNSLDGMVQMDVNSGLGMSRFSESIEIRERLN